METDELLKRAWAAVEKAGIPEHVQGVALQEAIADLRADDPAGPVEIRRGGGVEKKASKQRSRSAARGRLLSPSDNAEVTIDLDEFFAHLAHESGLDASELRDVLHVTADGKVQVSPPSKDLGSSAAEQARNVIALVAGGRAFGLGEQPVDANAVRREVERKRCYQQNNFASNHLGPMKGFNAGATKAEIRLTSKWVDEFKAAMTKARGIAQPDDE